MGRRKKLLVIIFISWITANDQFIVTLVFEESLTWEIFHWESLLPRILVYTVKDSFDRWICYCPTTHRDQDTANDNSLSSATAAGRDSRNTPELICVCLSKIMQMKINDRRNVVLPNGVVFRANKSPTSLQSITLSVFSPVSIVLYWLYHCLSCFRLRSYKSRSDLHSLDCITNIWVLLDMVQLFLKWQQTVSPF